jgi:cytochrome oxidase Cu insertion factor (SCO1/SenC/PrrC family)
VAQRSRRALTRGRWPLWISLAILAGAFVGDAVHLAQAPHAANLRLPEFHGQAAWAPGVRPAPQFALLDQDGHRVSLRAQRGRTLVVAFLSSSGRTGSAAEARALADADGLLTRAQRPVLDVVSTTPLRDTPSDVAAAAESWGLASSGEYHWLTGTTAQVAAVRRAYGVTRVSARRAIYLIDRRGFERAGYLYPFLPNFVALDLRTLAAQPR